MSELEKRKEFSQYNRLTTEELQQILSKHAHNELETEPDTEELFHIMEVLAERRQDTDSPAFRSDEDAFTEFCEHYMPKEKESVRPVIGFPKRIFKPAAAIVAIALVLTVGTTLTAKAFHFDIWSKFASWTKEVFQFADNAQEPTVANPEKEYNAELKSLQDALNDYTVTEKLAPSWMPEGYMCKDLKIKSTPRTLIIQSVYEKNGSELIIKIRQAIGTPANQVEKSDDLFEIYTTGGIDYYIFSNNENLQTKWSIGEFECVIGGNITLDEMKAMIDSIR